MLGEPCKACGAPIDKPAGKLCRKCDNAHRKTLPRYQKYLQEKAWRNTPWYRNKSYVNTPSNLKRLQDKAWNTYPKTCEACRVQYDAPSKISRLCPVCYARQLEIKTASKTRNKYKRFRIDGHLNSTHRYLAEQLFGRKLSAEENVHHLDEDPLNNDLSNLLVLSHSSHVSLHHYLDAQQVVEEKRSHPKPWSELVVPLSLQWLRDNKIPHLRLSELKAFKDQLLKQSKIASQPDLVQRLLEYKIQWHLYPGSFKIVAEIPEGLFKASGD
jgi:hypothetical protein